MDRGTRMGESGSKQHGRVPLEAGETHFDLTLLQAAERWRVGLVMGLCEAKPVLQFDCICSGTFPIIPAPLFCHDVYIALDFNMTTSDSFPRNAKPLAEGSGKLKVWAPSGCTICAGGAVVAL